MGSKRGGVGGEEGRGAAETLGTRLPAAGSFWGASIVARALTVTVASAALAGGGVSMAGAALGGSGSAATLTAGGATGAGAAGGARETGSGALSAVNAFLSGRD